MRLIRRALGLISPNPVFDTSARGARLPKRGSKYAAGLDLYASESYEIEPGKTVAVATGLRCRFRPGWVALLWDRSGMGFRGIHRYAGVIDSDYRGFWGVILHNSTEDTVVINSGDRIAQVIFQRCWTGYLSVGAVYDDTERGNGGFGSTGK